MHGPEHKALRKSFLSLFTTKALGVYVTLQVRTVFPPLRALVARRATAAAARRLACSRAASHPPNRTRWCVATWTAGWLTRR